MLSRPEFGEPAPAAESALSVTELNRRARGALERQFGSVRVRGEITGFTRAASGHVYLSLKDAGAQVRCAMWRARASALAFEPKNGDAVEVRASVTLFEARGEYQLSIESMRKAGAGQLYEQFLLLKQKLEGEGLFDNSRKRPLPDMPRGIGIVTSLQAAALRDVLITLSRRAPMIPIVVYPAPVQGEGAGSAVAQAIATAGERAARDGIEVLIVCRGGGSIEDLWAFNEEVVARAIAACPIPVVAGVGHETDVTIADWVADARAPTPTGAAEFVSPNLPDLQAALRERVRALRAAFDAHLLSGQQRLDWLTRALRPPSARLALQRQQLAHVGRRLASAGQAALHADRTRLHLLTARLRPVNVQEPITTVHHLLSRLRHAMSRCLTHAASQVERLSGEITMLNPAGVLARGYAIVRQGDGAVVNDAAVLKAGDKLAVQFARGIAAVDVESVSDK